MKVIKSLKITGVTRYSIFKSCWKFLLYYKLFTFSLSLLKAWNVMNSGNFRKHNSIKSPLLIIQSNRNKIRKAVCDKIRRGYDKITE